MGAARCGLLLVNLGTPTAPEPVAIRRFLREFLSDPRVVELPRWLWLPVLYGVILPFRARRLAQAYASIWTADGSPLIAISRRQQSGLQALLGDEASVILAMRYGEPSIASALDEFERQAVRRIVVLPLYPQYSATTTASIFDAVADTLRTRRWLPELVTIGDYHDDPGYIAALAQRQRVHWTTHGRGEHLLMSFHSIPQQCVDRGDPYAAQCQRTADLLSRGLELKPGTWSISYQSRLGRARWLTPYTTDAIPALAGQGLRRLDVVCPGFAADCLETLEEVAIRYRALWKESGGEELRYVAALNDAPAHLDALAARTRRALAAWQAPA